MRTLRMPLAGTVILVLLAGLAGTAIGSEAEVTGAVAVTGTESCTTVKMGKTTYDGPRQFRDNLSDCVDETSDPRVNGTFRNTFNEDCYDMDRVGGTACVMWGTHVKDGGEGGWDCSWSGTDDLWGPNVGQVLVVCPGTGGYAGLTYVFHHVFGDAQDWGDGTDIHGIIYAGPPPAWGPIPGPAD